jgi:hypothetical protein
VWRRLCLQSVKKKMNFKTTKLKKKIKLHFFPKQKSS